MWLRHSDWLSVLVSVQIALCSAYSNLVSRQILKHLSFSWQLQSIRGSDWLIAAFRVGFDETVNEWHRNKTNLYNSADNSLVTVKGKFWKTKTWRTLVSEMFFRKKTREKRKEDLGQNLVDYHSVFISWLNWTRDELIWSLWTHGKALLLCQFSWLLTLGVFIFPPTLPRKEQGDKNLLTVAVWRVGDLFPFIWSSFICFFGNNLSWSFSGLGNGCIFKTPSGVRTFWTLDIPQAHRQKVFIPKPYDL